MKIPLLVLALATLLTGPALAQLLPAAQVPAAARATFKARFPAVKTNTWEKEGANYEAGFRLNGQTMSALLTAAGALLETETDLPPAQLPAAVRAALARTYKGFKINEAATIVRANGTTVYEAEVAQGGKARDVLFRADGTPAQN